MRRYAQRHSRLISRREWLVGSLFSRSLASTRSISRENNVLDDAISRRPDYELVHLTVVSSSVTDRIRVAYARDEVCVAILQALSSAEFEHSKVKLSPP